MDIKSSLDDFLADENFDNKSLISFLLYCCIQECINFQDKRMENIIKRQYFKKCERINLDEDKFIIIFKSLETYYIQNKFLEYAEVLRRHINIENEALNNVYNMKINEEIRSVFHLIFNLKENEELPVAIITLAKHYNTNPPKTNSLINCLFQRKALPDSLKNYILTNLNQETVDFPENLVFDEKKKCINALILITKLKNIWENNMYLERNEKISEPTFTHQFVTHFVDYLMSGLKSVNSSWSNVESQATRNRNNQEGPKKFPDIFLFYKSECEELINFYYEFVFLEVSGGPFSNDSAAVYNHIKDDRIRLAKFCKDSFDHIFIKTKIANKYDFRNLKLYAFHIRKLATCEIPTNKPSSSEFITFFEILFTFQLLVKKTSDTIRLIDLMILNDDNSSNESHQNEESKKAKVEKEAGKVISVNILPLTTSPTSLDIVFDLLRKKLSGQELELLLPFKTRSGEINDTNT
ncbi:hypothetical protein Glove_500g4 [Diversispora epigaea]|uniref:Uncharacterized protein n=1 Tax=Diversispora epigaea TaxID=1348612 RepID=A0A397GJJ8_9GLOM|nr:hypothetical protein Glove_500g4 [Diversispora epigaea]